MRSFDMLHKSLTELCLLGCFFLLPLFTAGIPEGDEAYDTQTSGSFYVFADKVIHVVNPSTLEVVANITQDSNGNPLTNEGSAGSPVNTSRTWNDAVLLENTSKNLRHVLVNEGDVYVDGSGQEYSYVTAIDATLQKIVARIKVGALPVHIYTINATSSAWSHSDAEGTFYVLSPQTSSNITLNTTVPSYIAEQAHGKLVVNSALNPISYGTNVGEQVLEKFNLTTASRIGHFSYNSSLSSISNVSTCGGTHTIVYSQVNKHLYAECVDGSGTLEWNTVNDTLVGLLDFVGTLYNAPSGDLIFVTNTDNSTSAVLQPGANGKPSTLFQIIEVPYQPSDPVFYSNSSSITPANASSYTAFFPTLRNTNLNDIKQAQAVGSSVTSPDYYGQNTAAGTDKPTDCTYSNTTSSSGSGLLLANGTNGALTPSCGACAAGISPLDPSQYNASLAGMGVIELAAVTSTGSPPTARLVSAGAVAPQLSQDSAANQCSFAQISRDAVRGGSFIAVTADLPQPSIYILDAAFPNDALYGRGYVATADRPTTIVWVPSVEGVAANPPGGSSGTVAG